jgi:hypothetical protein
MRWRVVLLSSFLAAAIAGEASAVEPDLERRMRILLFQHHGPPDAAAFERAVPGAKARLFALASENTHALLKDRALVALAVFGGEDVRALYDAVLADRTGVLNTRLRVLTAYARAFPALALVPLEDALEAPEAELRLTAISALASLRTERARLALERAADVAQPDGVQEALRAALSR